jgi:hypothetical protein
MPVHVSDYVANLHFGTEQHSADLLLPFHFLPLEILAGDDGLVARITRSAPNGWKSRAVPAEFLEIDAGYWHRRHTRQGRSRIAANPQANPNKARLAARGRWTTPVLAEVRAVDACLRSDECNRYCTMRSRAWQCQIEITTRVSAMSNPRSFRHHLRGGTTLSVTQAHRAVSA